MPSAGFEPVIPAIEWQQTYALDRTATGNGPTKGPADGRAMAQAVSRRPLTAEARVRSRFNPCGICGGQSGTGTGPPPPRVLRFSPVSFIPTVLHYTEKRKN
jgi:hypothetical protein